MTDHSLYI